MIKLIIRQLVNSPFYPHWLEFYKRKRGDNYTLRNLKGKIIEVGAGDGSMKYELVKRYKKIEKYISTDYSSWNSHFKRRDKKAKKFWGLSAEFFKIRQNLPIDKICSALDIPYRESTFDYHLSFEVLEHVEDPNKFFKEASRVVKKGGYIILSVPFLYKIHGGEPNACLDYFRYTYGFFNEVVKVNNLKLVEIYSNTGFGTTSASLANQWLIQRILKLNIFIKIFLVVCSPVIFFLTNTLGYLIDIKPDKNFSTRFHVIMRKL